MEVLEARASELRERIRTEQAAGKVLGDVSHNGSTTTALQLAEGTFAAVRRRCRTRAGRWRRSRPTTSACPIYVITYGILVNTEMVKPADEPKSWKDLLDPRWKGKILADDMRALGGGAVFFMVTLRRSSAASSTRSSPQQEPHMNRELRGNYRRVARGEYPIYIPFTLPRHPRSEGPAREVDPARPRARPTSASTAPSSRARRIRTRRGSSWTSS